MHKYGKRWRFDFNAKKSAILTFGEDFKSNQDNSKYRIFKLGDNRVKERQHYDHVGVKVCLYKNNNPRVDEKIVKARRAFNACAGIGIRKNGLTMLTCNIIYWSIVIPILTFGSELWYLSEIDYSNLITFQRHMGKRIQRLPSRSPNSSSFYGLGWMRIPTYILIKKLLFAMSILRLKDNNVVRRVFIERVRDFKNRNDTNLENVHASPTFEILLAATKLGVLNILYDICDNRKTCIPKKMWSNCIWNKAWKIEDLYWASSLFLHKDNDLLVRSIGQTRYLSWWELSDKFPIMIRMCETMVKMLSHASKLKGDDIRLKGLCPSYRACSNCDMYTKEDLFHITMQCPVHEYVRHRMYKDLYQIDHRIERLFIDNPGEVFNWLIGKPITSLDNLDMYEIWCISGKYINDMYHTVCLKRDKAGIG